MRIMKRTPGVAPLRALRRAVALPTVIPRKDNAKIA